MIYTSVEQLIGNTPLLRLKKTEEKYGLCGKIYAKLEFFNPAGSVKDRVALSMIEDAERKGLIKPGSVIIEPTSGNTGIGLCAVAVSRGYKVIIVMPDSMSEERKILMKAYGGTLILTDGKDGMSGAIKKAEELSKEISGSFIAGQFENPANPDAHYKTTGPEIYRDLEGKVDIFVAGAGTGGTVSGTGKYLKEKIPSVKIYAAEPENSPVLTKNKSGAHKIQGIGAGFVPAVLDTGIYDGVIAVSDEDAIATARNLGKTEGFLAGISSGAALYSAITLAKKEENKDKNIVVILPDSGERYLSGELYKD